MTNGVRVNLPPRVDASLSIVSPSTPSTRSALALVFLWWAGPTRRLEQVRRVDSDSWDSALVNLVVTHRVTGAECHLDDDPCGVCSPSEREDGGDGQP